MVKGTAIVTGSARGIGKSIATRLARDGFSVVINDLPSNQTLIDSTVKEIEALGGQALGLAADVTVRADVQNLVDESTEKLGPLSVMVANAGIGHANTIFEMTEAHVSKVLDVNIKGVFNCYVVAGKKMLDQGNGGKIIGATSIAAFKPVALVSAYTASKWAVRGLTQVRPQSSWLGCIILLTLFSPLRSSLAKLAQGPKRSRFTIFIEVLGISF